MLTKTNRVRVLACLGFACTWLLGCGSRSAGITIDEYANHDLGKAYQVISLGQGLWIAHARGLASVTMTGHIVTVPVDSNDTTIGGIAYTRSGLWVTVPSQYLGDSNDYIAKISGSGVLSSKRKVPMPKAYVKTIVSAADGTLWFIEYSLNSIGRLSPTGMFSSYLVKPIDKTRPPADSYVGIDSLVIGPDGAIWFTEFLTDKIGRLTNDGKLSEISLGQGAGPHGIAVASDGSVWFTEEKSNKIGVLSNRYNLREFKVPTRNARLNMIAPGLDHDLWFTESAANKIGRIRATGEVKEYAIPGHSPSVITAGPDGHIWFVEDESSFTGFGTWAAVCRVSSLKE